jgi:hypothetical protein
MATDLETRPSSKSEVQLQRCFADLCARIQRVDLLAHLLTKLLVVAAYALAIGIFDQFVGNSVTANVVATRWSAWFGFLAFTTFLVYLAARCYIRRVNPYYVAHQLEAAIPGAKNGLINWLDLHGEDLPSAFQKNLSARAAEQWNDGDANQIVPRRTTWILLGTLSIPLLGLLILLALGPAAFAVSMIRALAPWYVPPTPILRTQIALVQPADGDIEVNPTQTVMFAAKISGRVPIGNRHDAPRLLWRYQVDEDYLAQPLQSDNAGLWSAQLMPTHLRTGLTYKLTAGDAETPEHRVMVRARAHIKKFEIAYRHRPYRQQEDESVTFPNANAARPHIICPRGSEVEMIVRTSRPVREASMELSTKSGTQKLPLERSKTDPRAFTCRWTLEQSGQFRVAYTADDGEENADRDAYPIDVLDDELPNVVITRPAKEIEVPLNAAFLVEGKASSAFGIRGMSLQLRVAGDATPISPLAYRPGKSFRVDDGSYPLKLDYMDLVALNQLKTPLTAGTTLEYWLEAADGADYPNATGNIGRSVKQKVKLLPPESEAKKDLLLNTLGSNRQEHEKKQDQKLKQDNKKKDGKGDDKKKGNGGGGGGGGGSGSGNPQQQMDKINKEQQGTKEKLDQAMQPNPGQGGDKGADPKPGESKNGPGQAPDAPQPKGKGESPMGKGNGGDKKDQNAGNGDAGQPRDESDKGKQSDKGPPQGNAKGQEQNGPESKGQKAKNDDPPPNAQAKSGKMNDPEAAKSDPKEGPPDPSKPAGQARDNSKKDTPQQPDFDRVAKNLKGLQDNGPDADKHAKDLADIAKNADDPQVRAFAKDVLVKNGRNPETGKKAKLPNPTGFNRKSPGIGDDIKTAAANREFAARLGQMQLDDWQKRITPDLLKKAGLTEADWQRYVENTRNYNVLVRQLNAEIARKALREMKGPRNVTGSGLNVVENTGSSSTAGGNTAPSPPELRGAVDRFKSRP